MALVSLRRCSSAFRSSDAGACLAISGTVRSLFAGSATDGLGATAGGGFAAGVGRLGTGAGEGAGATLAASAGGKELCGCASVGGLGAGDGSRATGSAADGSVAICGVGASGGGDFTPAHPTARRRQSSPAMPLGARIAIQLISAESIVIMTAG